ncbi:hypothetical protein FVB13_07980 [Escherichia coli]|jgi:hypothetical protein|uniref:hypothetical protein n=1 Tax=Escherichia coli TaxID=562 RepID=UPI00128E7DDC|nr:hypothetical protein [Escherichia coli]MPU29111.1 hypothetical protein [Escherichia coli]MPU39482.1 hypothetical protein [Escherichia coli]
MSDFENRIKELEAENDQLRFDIHALKVAVITISTVVNEGVGKTPGLMADTVESSLEFDSESEFDEEYFNKLKKEVVQLLGKKRNS